MPCNVYHVRNPAVSVLCVVNVDGPCRSSSRRSPRPPPRAVRALLPFRRPASGVAAGGGSSNSGSGEMYIATQFPKPATFITSHNCNIA